MSKNKAFISHKKNGKKSGKGSGNDDKSCFRMENSRALKAKKNKGFVRFKSKEKNAETIAKLNLNLDYLRSKGNSFDKKNPEFINPVSITNQQQQRLQTTTQDLNDAIDMIANL